MRLPHEHLIGQRMKAPLMRKLNGIELLNLIAEHGPVSRAGLAKLSRLSKPTVSSQVEQMIEHGWVVELGQGESGARGGKKPTLVRFNADAGRIFAVEINPGQLRFAAADLQGRILRRVDHPTGNDRRAAAVMSKIRRHLAAIIDAEGGDASQRAIAVASPGRVDVRRGVTVEAGNVFNWKDVQIRATLEDAFGIPVAVDNNVKMATLGELYFGVAKGCSDVVVVRLDTGLGSGVVVRGRLFHGRHWAAGEIAHMVLDLDRAGEDWRARGYLESVVGADRITEDGLRSPEAAAAALRAAGSGTKADRAMRERVALHAGVAIANLTLTYDPAVVVLQGELFDAIFDDVRAIVARTVPWDVRLERSAISADAVLLGTVSAGRALAYDGIARHFDGREPAAPDRTAVAGA